MHCAKFNTVCLFVLYVCILSVATEIVIGGKVHSREWN